jgi:hypothetical protein
VIDISESVAKKTVRFDRSVRGSELIEAVRAACTDESAQQSRGYGDGTSFYEDRRYDDGDCYLIGQQSAQPHQNLLVTPNKTDVYIRPEEYYDSAVVVSHDLGGGQRYAVRVSRDDEINAVVEFAGKLPQYVRAGQQQDAGRSRDPYAPAAGAVRRQPDSPQASPWRRDAPSAEPRGY